LIFPTGPEWGRESQGEEAGFLRSLWLGRRVVRSCASEGGSEELPGKSRAALVAPPGQLQQRAIENNETKNHH